MNSFPSICLTFLDKSKLTVHNINETKCKMFYRTRQFILCAYYPCKEAVVRRYWYGIYFFSPQLKIKQIK